jgi:hypothetical protein
MFPTHAPLRWLQRGWRRYLSASRPARPRSRPLLELLEDRTTPSAGLLDPPAAVYVNPAFSGALGSDPDGAGPATALGYDAFADLQAGIDAVAE